MNEVNAIVKQGADVLGKALLLSSRDAVSRIARSLVLAVGDLIPESEREKEIETLTAEMMESMAPGFVEFAEAVLGMVETIQKSTIDAVLKAIAEEGQTARSDGEFKFLVRIVRAVESGAWKKHVPEQRA